MDNQLDNIKRTARPSGTVLAGYDAADDMVKVKSVQKKFRDSFTGSSLNLSKWTSNIGDGGSIVVGNGLATLNSGTVPNSETWMLTTETFTIPFRINIGLTLSQRIANQTFFVEAISVDSFTLEPDGLHHVAYLFRGTSATQAQYSVQNSGATPLVSPLSTIASTASGSYYEIEPFSDETWFHAGVLDSANGRTQSFRRHQQVPDPNAIFKVRLRWLNDPVAPASNTACNLQYLSIQDYAELTAEITAGRGNISAGQAMAVHVVNPISAVVNPIIANEGTARIPSAWNINSAATTNATAIRTSAATLYNITASNQGASRAFIKLYNSSSAPNVGTTIPVLTIPVPSNECISINFGANGHRFTTGIGLAITRNAADNDNTAVGAGEVKVLTSFI